MESDDFTRHYIIRYLSARELVLPPLENEEHVVNGGMPIYDTTTSRLLNHLLLWYVIFTDNSEA